MTPPPGTLALAGTELEDASRSPTAGDKDTLAALAADSPWPSSLRSPVPAAGLSFSLLTLEIKI